MSNSKKITTTTDANYRPQRTKLPKSTWLVLQYLQSLATNNEHERHSFLYQENFPTQQEIANKLGISRATVGAALKKLKESEKILESGKAYLFPYSGTWAFIPKEKIDALFSYVKAKSGLGTIIRVYAILLWAKKEAASHPLCVTDFIVAMGLDNNTAARREILECLGYLDFANFARIGKMRMTPKGKNKKPYTGYWVVSELEKETPFSFSELIGDGEATLSEELVKRMCIELGDDM